MSTPLNHLPLTARSHSRPRVLILTAAVGEGHSAAAGALALQLQAHNVDTIIIDGLAAMGERTRRIVSDGYRSQLRKFPHSYALYYWLLRHFRPVRALTRFLLTRAGGNTLQEEITRHNPDIIVSTYPVITVVLSFLRRRGLRIPVVATITDMAGLFFWAQPGIDRHLVMYSHSLAEVEHIAGRGSAQLVAPLIAPEFLCERTREAARAAQNLPQSAHIILVSGGGWGVGDLAGTVEHLLQIPESLILCLSGRNKNEAERLRERFANQTRVRVLGFTKQMPDLLTAADVIVHSTGGVTCLEAFSRGCPVVVYGLSLGHAKLNGLAMAKHDLVAAATNGHQLIECVQRSQRHEIVENTTEEAAAAVLSVRPRF